ncbi:Uncharacterised protein [Bordetella pertussis]|nr:Uncharacterised protein [Bordetella pertussis]CPI10526.1 Uncharacterised protein [Bordetella pertussis]CPN62308.1 Uncharacterised protein [Bordetella pertussis]
MTADSTSKPSALTVRASPLTVPPGTVPTASYRFQFELRSILISIVSLSLAPTWIDRVMSVALDFRTLMPLKSVCSAMRLISSRRWLTSCWIESMSEAEFVPLEA